MTLIVTNYANGENLTENVLNRPVDEIVDYINNQKTMEYTTDPSVLNVTVGNTGADFSSLQDAINYLRRFQPIYSPSATEWNTSNQLPGSITIKAGFVVEESVFVLGSNMGWVSVFSEDSVVFVDPIATQHLDFAGGGQKVGIYGSASFMPYFRASFGVTSSGVNNYDLFYMSNGSMLNLEGTFNGPTGVGSHAVHAGTRSTAWVSNNTINRGIAMEGGTITIVNGSFDKLDVFRGGQAYIAGSEGTRAMNIPTNTLTPHGIIFE